MKSREKVITQKHIKEIPAGMFGFKGFGLMGHGIDNITLSKQAKRKKRNYVLVRESRKQNRRQK